MEEEAGERAEERKGMREEQRERLENMVCASHTVYQYKWCQYE